MKTWRNILILSLALLLAAPALGGVIGKDDQEIKAAADPILDNLLAGMNEGNYQQYARDFDDTLKDAIPEKKFSQTRTQILEKLGKYQSRSYLGALKQGNMSVVLWKGRFEKSDSDVLIKLVVSKRQDKIVVTGLWFQ
jgi:hypothetical protein